jgi:hypothetical protein
MLSVNTGHYEHLHTLLSYIKSHPFRGAVPPLELSSVIGTPNRSPHAGKVQPTAGYAYCGCRRLAIMNIRL